MVKLDWIPILVSKPYRILTLYYGQKYLGCVIHRQGELFWKVIPYQIGERSRVTYRGSYSQAAHELENWARNYLDF